MGDEVEREMSELDDDGYGGGGAAAVRRRVFGSTFSRFGRKFWGFAKLYHFNSLSDS